MSSKERSRAPKTEDEDLSAKRSVVTVRGVDAAASFWHALFLSMLVSEGKAKGPEWKSFTNHATSRFEKTTELARQCNLKYDSPADESSYTAVSDYLATVGTMLVVFTVGLKKTLVFKSAIYQRKVAFLVCSEKNGENFYHSITNVQGFLGARMFCIHCEQANASYSLHSCEWTCEGCQFWMPCEAIGEPISCDNCARSFVSAICYEQHKHLCKHVKVCKNCLLEYNAVYKGEGKKQIDTHRCDFCYCKKCDEHYQGVHHCVLRKRSDRTIEQADSKKQIFVFYDLECENEDEHVPVLGVMTVVCDSCYDPIAKEKIVQDCSACWFKERVYDARVFGVGPPLIQAMIQDLMALSKRFAKKKVEINVIAHNAKGYDVHFFFVELLNLGYVNAKIVPTGSKIMRLELKNLQFSDSLLFVPMPLAAIPKAFGFEESKKGDFPVRMISREHMGKSFDRLPALEWYCPGDKKDKARKELEAWHASESEKYDSGELSSWNYDFELTEYCRNDVKILMKGVMAFRQLVREISGFDPYSCCFTIAMLTMETYNRKCMDANSQISITPANGCYSTRKSSVEANSWLSYLDTIYPRPILREVKLGKYFADGYDPEENRVFEYFGCRWHGCPKCFSADEIIHKNDEIRTAGELYAETCAKLNYYALRGKPVTAIWGCEFAEELKRNSELKSIKKQFQEIHEAERSLPEKMRGPLNVNHAFFGGRTNNLAFYHHVDETAGGEIKYFDFTSLYPHVLRNKAYPRGHPEVIRKNFDFSLKSYNVGFVKCRILPPRGLWIPVLPVKHDNKLLFPLCMKCVEERDPSIVSTEMMVECNHSNKDRSIVGTWCIAEVELALEKGYKIDQIFEVLNWTKTDTSSFRGMVDEWLKVKQEASGYPADVVTEEQKDEYIERYFQAQGIRLDKDKIAYNPSLRTIAKLNLNSLWGKFVQKNNKLQCVLASFDEAAGWFLREDIEVASMEKMTESLVAISWRYVKDEDAPTGSRCVVLGAHVTAYARIELFRVLDKIEAGRQFRILYMDTDSVVFIQLPCDRENDKALPIGDFLGQLTSEIAAGSRMVEFWSSGPKCYGYKCKSLETGKVTDVSMKYKGVTLTSEAAKLMTHSTMVEKTKLYFQGHEVEEIPVPQFVIRTNKRHKIRSDHCVKRVKPTSDKRRILTNGFTYPYGY